MGMRVCMYVDMCLCVHVCHEAASHMDAYACVLHVVATKLGVPLPLPAVCVCNEAGSHMDACVLHAVATRWVCRCLFQLFVVHFAFSYSCARVLASVLGAVRIGTYIRSKVHVLMCGIFVQLSFT